MKAEEASSDLERLRALFAAERSANFPEFTDVYCVDAADHVLARFARGREQGAEALEVGAGFLGLHGCRRMLPACEALSEVLQGIFDTGSFELLVLSTRCASCYRTASGRKL